MPPAWIWGGLPLLELHLATIEFLESLPSFGGYYIIMYLNIFHQAWQIVSEKWLGAELDPNLMKATPPCLATFSLQSDILDVASGLINLWISQTLLYNLFSSSFFCSDSLLLWGTNVEDQLVAKERNNHNSCRFRIRLLGGKERGSLPSWQGFFQSALPAIDPLSPTLPSPPPALPTASSFLPGPYNLNISNGGIQSR